MAGCSRIAAVAPVFSCCERLPQNFPKLLQTAPKKLPQKVSYIYLAPKKLSHACLNKTIFLNQNTFLHVRKELKLFRKISTSSVSILTLFSFSSSEKVMCFFFCVHIHAFCFFPQKDFDVNCIHFDVFHFFFCFTKLILYKKLSVSVTSILAFFVFFFIFLDSLQVLFFAIFLCFVIFLRVNWEIHAINVLLNSKKHLQKKKAVSLVDNKLNEIMECIEKNIWKHSKMKNQFLKKLSELKTKWTFLEKES